MNLLERLCLTFLFSGLCIFPNGFIFSALASPLQRRTEQIPWLSSKRPPSQTALFPDLSLPFQGKLSEQLSRWVTRLVCQPWRLQVAEPNCAIVSIAPAVQTGQAFREGDGSELCMGLSSRKSLVLFQVLLQGQVVAELPTYPQAEQIAQHLQKVLQKVDLQPESLQPFIMDHLAIGMTNDEVLFVVDPSMVEALGCSSETIAIRWTNRLRQALGVAPLKFAEAQMRMHSLISTPTQFEGVASWYGLDFHGRRTATGEIFDQTGLTAAHPSLPFNTFLQVTNPENGNSVIVRINDRSEYSSDRSLDLSRGAIRQLQGEAKGLIRYQATVLQPGSQSNRENRLKLETLKVKTQQHKVLP